MFLKNVNRVLLVGIALALSASLAIAQPIPDAWSVVNNPSGDRAVPHVKYDQVTGILSVDTRGLNGTDDTPDASMAAVPIGADDVGLISLLVPSVSNVGNYLAPFTGLDLIQFLTWDGRYFANKWQLIGNPLLAAGNQFLWPGVYDVLQLTPGLDASNFGPVEMAVNFNQGVPGAVLNSIQPWACFNGMCAPGLIPEPASLSVLGTILLCLAGIVRRR